MAPKQSQPGFNAGRDMFPAASNAFSRFSALVVCPLVRPPQLFSCSSLQVHALYLNGHSVEWGL